MPFDSLMDTTFTSLAPVVPSKKAALHHLFKVWSERRGERRSPFVTEVSMINDPVLNGVVTVLDVMNDGQFRFVYVGTRIVNFMQRNVTGLMLNEDLYGDTFSDIQDKLFFVAAFNMPMCMGIRIHSGNEWKEIEWMSVPLSDETGTCKRIVNAVSIVDESSPWALPAAPDRYEMVRDYEDCASMAENCTTSPDPVRDRRCALYEHTGLSCADLGCPHLKRA